ncbi:hypothetical protein Taro_008915, partial [Colocasia esculenta]|nr:hypothetical protein [Colocasia esculenta]
LPHPQKGRSFLKQSDGSAGRAVHDKVWLFNSQLHLFSGKLKSGWDGPYIVVRSYDNGAVIILDPKNRQSFTPDGSAGRAGKQQSCSVRWRHALDVAGSGCAGAAKEGGDGTGRRWHLMLAKEL